MSPKQLCLILLVEVVLSVNLISQELELSVEQITRGPMHHFFGYIGQSQTTPWNASQRYILMLRTTFHDRMPTANDQAEIVLLDTQQGYREIVVDRTRAWNFQQGTMLYWNPDHPESQFFFNDRDTDTQKIFTVLYDVSQRRRIREYRFDDLPVANGGVCPQGGFFLAINYARMARLRPVTGYPDTFDPTDKSLAPDNDGLFRIDIDTGERKLLASFRQLQQLVGERYEHALESGLYINHSLCNRTGEYVYFYTRGNYQGVPLYVNVPCSVRTDGTDLRAHEFIGGHPEWDLGTVVIGAKGDQQVRYDILSGQVVGSIGKGGDFPNPGADKALSTDGNWFANGWALSGGKENAYLLMRRTDGLFVRSPPFSRGKFTEGNLRIDQAPCWNRTNDAILISAMSGENTRQSYILRLVPKKKRVPTSAWRRHTIDDSSRGADGIRLADANGDGLQDIVTGWEEGGKVRLYLNPGHENVAQRWPAVTVGSVFAPEDAVMADLDNDGALDVITSCEGKQRTMFVHWAPQDRARLLDESAWKTQAIPCTQGQQMWMFALPVQMHKTGRWELVVGSKGDRASVGWLEISQDARNVNEWKYHQLSSAGWIMTLDDVDVDHDGDIDILYSDRKGPTRGVKWIENTGRSLKDGATWPVHVIGAVDREVMFVARGSLAKDQGESVFAAVKPRSLLQFARPSGDIKQPWRWNAIEFAAECGTSKGVAVGDIDLDLQPDLVFSCEQAVGPLSGVRWLRNSPGADGWQAYEISGPSGTKYDRIELIDLDGDGDLDVLTCEEAENLGVIWYENPVR